jgi:hypothetical protein
VQETPPWNKGFAVIECEIGDNPASTQFDKARLCNSYLIMRLIGGKLRQTAWVALFALLIQALLPSFIYAAAPKNSALGEICTAFGIKKVAGKVAATPHDTSVSGTHCPVCALAGAIALPFGQLSVPFPPAAVFAASEPAGSQHYPRVRLSVYLRGPPSHV